MMYDMLIRITSVTNQLCGYGGCGGCTCGGGSSG
jgi:hypothetical protein